MSWNVSFIGSPEKVSAALEAANEGLTGQSKLEWDEAKPHLLALVRQNFVADEHRDRSPGPWSNPAIKLNASGSGTSQDGRQMQRSCSVSIELLFGLLD